LTQHHCKVQFLNFFNEDNLTNIIFHLEIFTYLKGFS
jgi:hypothetical protein